MKSMDAEELKKTLDVNERMVREKIQQIRTKKGLSMAEFGKLLGCERQTVFKYEKGLIKTIPLEVIIKIAQIGNTPPLDLLIPAFRARTPKAHYKVLYRVDKEDPWEHLVVFYNDITLSDGLENKKLEPVEILKRLADCGKSKETVIMANLTHLFKIGENIKYVVNDFDEKKIYDGTVKEVAADHVLVDIPEISDHMWFEEGMNLDMLYPAYNFTEK